MNLKKRRNKINKSIISEQKQKERIYSPKKDDRLNQTQKLEAYKQLSSNQAS